MHYDKFFSFEPESKEPLNCGCRTLKKKVVSKCFPYTAENRALVSIGERGNYKTLVVIRRFRCEPHSDEVYIQLK